MTRELFWLTLTVILTGLMWVPYVLNRLPGPRALRRDGKPVAQRQAARRNGPRR